MATSLLFLVAGGGLKASLWWGDKAQKIGGAVVAVLLAAFAQWLASGFSVQLFGHPLSGGLWGWIGFATCFVFATKKLAGQSVPVTAAPPSSAALLGALGELMEQHPTALMDTSRLLAPKQRMKAVIKEAWQKEPGLRPQLAQAYLYLSHFQDGIGDVVLDSKFPATKTGADGAPDLEAVRQQAIELTGPKGENFRQWIEWSKLSLSEMETLSQEWRAFESQASA
jgi:hypothetical protein